VIIGFVAGVLWKRHDRGKSNDPDHERFRVAARLAQLASPAVGLATGESGGAGAL